MGYTQENPQLGWTNPPVPRPWARSGAQEDPECCIWVFVAGGATDGGTHFKLKAVDFDHPEGPKDLSKIGSFVTVHERDPEKCDTRIYGRPPARPWIWHLGSSQQQQICCARPGDIRLPTYTCPWAHPQLYCLCRGLETEPPFPKECCALKGPVGTHTMRRARRHT